MSDKDNTSVAAAVTVGLSSLAAAMGIGRFAFTPLLPLMQETFGLTLTQGAWLAPRTTWGISSGALSSFLLNPPAGLSARLGLLAVAVSTLLIGLTGSFAAWFALRLFAGIGSAFVLVGASAWAMSHLAFHRRPEASGWVFAEVGIGVIVAGSIALAFGVNRLRPETAWVLLGVLCALVAAVTWKQLSVSTAEVRVQEAQAAPQLGRSEWTLVACYGVFGFGYIIPATFIPAAARALVNDPAVFGWTLAGFRSCRGLVHRGGFDDLQGHAAPSRRVLEPGGDGSRCGRAGLSDEGCRASCFGTVRRGHIHGHDDGGRAGGSPHCDRLAHQADGRVDRRLRDRTDSRARGRRPRGGDWKRRRALQRIGCRAAAMQFSCSIEHQSTRSERRRALTHGNTTVRVLRRFEPAHDSYGEWGDIRVHPRARRKH